MGISKFLAVAANTVSGNPEPSVGVVVATGLIIVFGVLVLLYLLITLEGIIFTSVDQKEKGTPAPKKKAAPAPVPMHAAAPQSAGRGSRYPGRGHRGHCRRDRLHGWRRTLYAAQCQAHKSFRAFCLGTGRCRSLHRAVLTGGDEQTYRGLFKRSYRDRQ